MAKRTVSLYIDDTSLRLTVTQGRQVKDWAELPLEPGLVESNIVIEETEVAARIQQLFEMQKLKNKKITLGISGLHCLTRPIALPKLPKEMLEEAVRREAARALPVPPEELYISWQSIPSSEEEEESKIFLVAIPIAATDALFRTLQQTGLKPDFMDVKPLLLIKLIPETTAVLVDVQATEFDIVIMFEGVPQPVRSIAFAERDMSGEDKLAIIINELNRTITFYDSNNPEKALEPSVPLYISGELANESELCQTLSDSVGHPVIPLESPLECPVGLDPNNFMANISLSSPKPSPGKKAEIAVVSLNILPAAYLPKPISLANVLAIPGAVLAVGLIIFLMLLIQTTSTDINSLQTKLNRSDQLLSQRQSQQQELSGKIADLEAKVTEKETSKNNYSAAIDILEGQSEGVNSDLEVAIFKLPSSIELSNVSHITSILTITGKAPGESQILSYIQELDDSGRFGDITIIDLIRTDDGIDFTLLGTIEVQGIGASSLEIALGSLPAGVSLTGVRTDIDRLTVDGIAPNEEKIFSYLRALEASARFKEIVISNMIRIADEMDFTLILKTGE